MVQVHFIFKKKLDKIDYKIKKIKKIYSFKQNLKIKNNQFRIDILNYEKKKNIDLELHFG